uniref:Uncharacterized protein n=1 Tax=Arundo donax TaxID=35708 RepID=A0A0A9EV30_ARUDO
MGGGATNRRATDGRRRMNGQVTRAYGRACDRAGSGGVRAGATTTTRVEVSDLGPNRPIGPDRIDFIGPGRIGPSIRNIFLFSFFRYGSRTSYTRIGYISVSDTYPIRDTAAN